MNALTPPKANGSRALQELTAAFGNGFRPSIKTIGELLRALDLSLKDDPLYLWLENTPAVCAADIEKAEWVASTDQGAPDDSWMGRQDGAFSDARAFSSGPLVLDGERRGV